MCSRIVALHHCHHIFTVQEGNHANLSFRSKPGLRLFVRLRPQRGHFVLGRVELGVHLPLGVLRRAIPVLSDPLL